MSRIAVDRYIVKNFINKWLKKYLCIYIVKFDQPVANID